MEAARQEEDGLRQNRQELAGCEREVDYTTHAASTRSGNVRGIACMLYEVAQAQYIAAMGVSATCKDVHNLVYCMSECVDAAYDSPKSSDGDKVLVFPMAGWMSSA